VPLCAPTDKHVVTVKPYLSGIQ
jgi:hypothetical protein